MYVELNGELDRHIKGLYGVKQYSRLWHEKFSGVLKEFGFKRLESSECVFTRANGDNKVIVTLYIDELIIMGAKKPSIDGTKAMILVNFK